MLARSISSSVEGACKCDVIYLVSDNKKEDYSSSSSSSVEEAAEKACKCAEESCSVEEGRGETGNQESSSAEGKEKSSSASDEPAAQQLQKKWDAKKSIIVLGKEYTRDSAVTEVILPCFGVLTRPFRYRPHFKSEVDPFVVRIPGFLHKLTQYAVQEDRESEAARRAVVLAVPLDHPMMLTCMDHVNKRSMQLPFLVDEKRRHLQQAVLHGLDDDMKFHIQLPECSRIHLPPILTNEGDGGIFTAEAHMGFVMDGLVDSIEQVQWNPWDDEDDNNTVAGVKDMLLQQSPEFLGHVASALLLQLVYFPMEARDFDKERGPHGSAGAAALRYRFLDPTMCLNRTLEKTVIVDVDEKGSTQIVCKMKVCFKPGEGKHRKGCEVIATMQVCKDGRDVCINWNVGSHEDYKERCLCWECGQAGQDHLAHRILATPEILEAKSRKRSLRNSSCSTDAAWLDEFRSDREKRQKRTKRKGASKPA